MLVSDSSRTWEAEAAHRREVELWQQAAAKGPPDPFIREQLAHSHRLWGLFLQDSGRLPEAEEAFRKAVKVLDEMPSHRALLGDTYACLANVLSAAGKRDEAAEAFRKALECPLPNTARDCNHLAWTLATIPDASLGDGYLAVELASRAVELAPDDGEYWHTLGVACCRATDWETAVEALEKANELVGARTESITNAFFLAIAHWHLGHNEQAWCWYDQAVASMEKCAPRNARNCRLRAESERLIATEGPAQSETADRKKNNGR